jgi:hypothetical protein
MEDNKFINEEEITFNLMVESVGDLYAGLCVRQWPSP